MGPVQDSDRGSQSKYWARSRNVDQHQACHSPPSGCRCEDPSRFRHTGFVIMAVLIVICAAGVYGKIVQCARVPAAERAEATYLADAERKLNFERAKNVVSIDESNPTFEMDLS